MTHNFSAGPKSPSFDIEYPEEGEDYYPPEIMAKMLMRKWNLKLLWALILLAAFIVGVSTNTWQAIDIFVP